MYLINILIILIYYLAFVSFSISIRSIIFVCFFYSFILSASCMRVATILYLMAVEALVSAISCIFIHIMLIHYSNALIKRAQIWLAITQIQAHISGYNFPSCEIIDHYSHYFIIFLYYSYIHHE